MDKDSDPILGEADIVAGTLAPDSAEEATTLIPSLVGKIDPETLQPILEELAKMRMCMSV